MTVNKSLLVTAFAFLCPSVLSAQDASVALRTSRILDGRGGVIDSGYVVVRDGRIVDVTDDDRGDPSETVYDLTGLTVLPGLIDTHVHIGWHFDRTGRTQSREVEETPETSILYAVENAYVTLMGGVTTVQSMGSPSDKELRDAIRRGIIPGPRVLTSLRAVSARTGAPDEIREFVRELAHEGADVIKIFASASIRDGGPPTLSMEQLEAACGEAKGLGLRTAVHAHGPESARRSVLAGCTVIEHGALLDRETLQLMARHGTYYDPNIDLIFRNYFENKERFLGVGNYTEEGFAKMERAVPSALSVFREALTIPELKVVFGTDAVAGAHGRNAEELVYRVEHGGQGPMDAIVSATSLAAESLELDNEIGSIATGMVADIIAVDGDPTVDISALKRVVFVMRNGMVYKNMVGREVSR